MNFSELWSLTKLPISLFVDVCFTLNLLKCETRVNVYFFSSAAKKSRTKMRWLEVSRNGCIDDDWITNDTKKRSDDNWIGISLFTSACLWLKNYNKCAKDVNNSAIRSLELAFCSSSPGAFADWVTAQVPDEIKFVAQIFLFNCDWPSIVLFIDGFVSDI